MQRSDPPAPRVVVLSSLFPSAVQPGAGLFVRERAFRLGQRMPLSVVAPTPWFPLQAQLRRWRPGARAGAPAREIQSGFEVSFPRFLSLPLIGRRFDGLFMALGALPLLWRLRRQGRLDLIDAHFAYPDGRAATWLGRWLKVPVTITMRGTEVRHAGDRVLRRPLRRALTRADRVFSVSDSLRQVALSLGVAAERAMVVGNGVDLQRFYPLPRDEARRALGLPELAKVMITVGGLVERKGFHRVLEVLPALSRQFEPLHYLIVGGPSPEGDMSRALREQVQALGLFQQVHFAGAVSPDELRRWLSAADLFVLATRNEGWANVFLEAMACGLPVVTTDVGGNAEVVCSPELGRVVPFGDSAALRLAVAEALAATWDRDAIRAYAQANTWDRRIDRLEEVIRDVACSRRPPMAQAEASS